MRFFRKTSIDFLSVRKYAYLGSLSIILLGIGSLFVKGIDLGIDFRGGTEIVLRFATPPSIADLRTSLTRVGLSASEIKAFGTEGDILIRTREDEAGTAVGDTIRTALQQSMPGTSFEVLKQYKVSPKIGKELRQDAFYAVIASLFVILGYVAVRFKFIYGVGAVVALFHDVLATLGTISLLNGVIPQLNLEISLEVIAAFLTLVGVSVNDTVVVFDRIRENEKIYRSMSLYDVMNKSINDTLSRTIITNGTILVVLATLLFMGGEVTRGFAFTLTVGQIFGTYSTTYIASAIVLDWDLRKHKAKS
jgi:preprotein translocase subunit SecF